MGIGAGVIETLRNNSSLRNSSLMAAKSEIIFNDVLTDWNLQGEYE